jgi:uncharacterized protein with PQ loop repeat
MPLRTTSSASRRTALLYGAIAIGALLLTGCAEDVVRDVPSLLSPRLHRSEVFGFLAGLGTTFAALPDLIRMIRQRSSAGINPTMAGITGGFQLLWIYYGFLITSRPVIAWNLLGSLINLVTLGAYLRFVKLNRASRSRGLPTP